jgi:hypothetical protein
MDEQTVNVSLVEPARPNGPEFRGGGKSRADSPHRSGETRFGPRHPGWGRGAGLSKMRGQD